MTQTGTWNVRTLFESRKLAQVFRERKRYRLEVLGINEMRWTGQGKLTSEDTTVLYSREEENHVKGLGFLLGKSATAALVGWKPVSS